MVDQQTFISLGFIIFFIGLFFGSFFQVVADRFMDGRSVIFGRSACDYCKHVLSWKDLIPVFSFLFSQGKCRYCNRKLSFFYPVSELFTAVLFLLIFLKFGLSILFVFNLIIVSVLIVVFLTDIKYGLIPFPAVLFGSIVVIIYLLSAGNLQLFSSHLLSGIATFLSFLALYFITMRKGIGFGDVIFAFFMGLFLGVPMVFLALYLAFLTGAAISLILVLTGKKKLRGDSIAFGPFLVLGVIMCMFWGDYLLSVVFSYFRIF